MQFDKRFIDGEMFLAHLFFFLFSRYAIRESNSIVKIFKNFKEKKSFKPDFGAEGNVNVDV